MQAESKDQVSSNIDAARPELADTKTQERPKTPPSQGFIKVQINQYAAEIAADPR